MSAPTAPIDADLSEQDGISYFVLEVDGIWLTQNPGGGSATWTQVFDAATFLAAYPGYAEVELLRLCCSVQTANKVYVLAWAKLTAGASVGDAYLFRSANNGATWTYNYIANQTAKGYTVEHKIGAVQNIGGHGYVTLTFTRQDSGSARSPICISVKFHNYVWTPNMLADATTINNTPYNPGIYGRTNWQNWMDNSVLGGYPHADSIAAFNSCFGAGNWSWVGNPMNMDVDPARIYIKGDSATTADWLLEGWVFWAKPSVPKALAVSRNTQAIYVGCEAQIYKSLDDGFTWTALPTAEGATDIIVDPLLGGVIYYWCTDGKVKMAVADTTPIVLLTETRQENFLTLARDFNSGKLWAIDSSGDLQLYNLGIWSTQKSGLIGGCGMRTYYASPTKLVMLDNSDIYLSLDAGATWANKKGGWSAYASPKTIHLLVAP